MRAQVQEQANGCRHGREQDDGDADTFPQSRVRRRQTVLRHRKTRL
jgi:hypothetical protein